MDKRVIFAVAGSGKTTFIINKLNLENRFLIITYTNNNYNNLRLKIIEKFGYLPHNIALFTYFNFIYSFCYKPFLNSKLKLKGINFYTSPFYNASGMARFIDNNKRIYHNRITKLFEKIELNSEIISRIESYFDYLLIDEVQDFGGNDFNFLEIITKADVNMLFVGDFFQHTYDTSYDGTTNKSLYNDYGKYENRFRKLNFYVDLDTLKYSYRCTTQVCDFIKDNLNIQIASYRKDSSKVTIITEKKLFEEIYNTHEIIKLFLDEHYKYNCYSMNWGQSKGIDNLNNVCVVLNKNTEDLFSKNNLNKLAQRTKNKLYVACTRTRNDLYLLPISLLKSSQLYNL